MIKLHKLIIPFVLTTIISCSKNVTVLKDKIFCFDTFVEVKLFDGCEDDISEINSIVRKIDKLTDNYQSRVITNVYDLNQTNEKTVVEYELYDLLEKSVNVKNEGATNYNPLCGNLAKLWKNSLKNKQILDENIINEELEKINSSSLEFDNNNSVTRLGEAEIDLGGIAKGYTLDLIYDYLITNKVDQYIINAGGSSILLGEKYENAGYFNLELSDIPGKRLKLKNCVVSTSGVSEQSTVIDGKRYSHIINPVTGSALAQYDSVRVVTDYGYLGDALSTSLMMNSIDEIKELEAEYDFMTLVVKDGKILYRNPNLKVY